MKFNFKALLVIYFFTSIHFLNAQKISSFEGKSKEELFNWSIDTNVKEEKQKLRNYLAQKFPNTMEGETSKAWLAIAEGYDENGTQMYLEIIKKYPKPWLAIYNTSSATKDNIDEVVANFEKILTEEPEYSNYGLVRNLYFTLQEIDKKVAEGKLLYWEGKLGSDIYAFDFVRGLIANDNKDYKLAETYYASALTKTGGSNELELWTRLIELRKDKLFDNEHKTFDDQVALYMSLADEAKLHMNKSAIVDKAFAAGALEFIGDFFKANSYFKNAKDMYASAFRIYPSYTLIEKQTSSMLQLDGSTQNGLDALINAEIYLPDNASLQNDIAWKYMKVNNAESSEKYYKIAIENAVLIKDKYSYSTNLCFYIYDQTYFNYAESESIYNSFIGKTNNDANIYFRLNENSLNAGNYAKAKEYLLKYNEIFKKQSNYNSTYFDGQLSAINSCQKNKENLDNYYKDKPFEKQWNANYKDGLQLYINFPINSAVIPASDYPKLKTLAGQITDNGADDYSFLISGHTDNTGSDLTNDALSLKRAKAITDYLFTNYKIPYVRMEVNGFGSKQPIEDNLTESGRAKNRRVEISLSANISKPEIAVTTTIPGYKTNFSDGGNGILTGFYPMELWDVKEKIRIKTFYQNQLLSRQISPNSKYIAGIVNYNKNYFLLIIDFKTEQVIQQQAVAYDSDSLYQICWSKTSTELIVAARSGTILLYDVRNSKSLKTYSTQNNVIINLTADGKYLFIIHSHQNGILEIVDAKTFEKILIKNDLKWPRALASSYDGKHLMIYDNSSELLIYDTDTWEVKKIKASFSPLNIASHPSKNIFLINDGSGKEGDQLETIDIDKMSVIATKHVSLSQPSWQFSPDGSKIMGYIEDHIEILDPITLKTIDKIEPTTSNFKGAFKDGENQMITVDKESINIWNVKTGTKNHYWLATPVFIRQLDAPNEFLALNEDKINQKTLFTQYNSTDYTKKELFEIPFQVDKWVIKDDKIIILAKHFLPISQGNKYGQVLVYDAKSYALINSFEVLLQDGLLTYNLYSSNYEFYDISPDGNKLSFSAYWQDGYGHDFTYTDFIRIYDLNTGKEIKKIINSSSSTFLSSSKIKVGDRTYDLNTDTSEIATKEENDSNSLVKNKSDNNSYSLDFENLNLHIDASGDNQFVFSNKTTKENILTLVSKRNNEWIAYAPSGEFASSLNGTDRVNWILGSRRLPFNALKKKFENPNLLKNKLAAVVSNVTPVVTPVVAPIIKVEPDLFVAPYKMELVSEPFITTKADNYDVKIKINKDIASLPDATVVFELNGRKISDRGFGVAAVVKSSTEYVISKNIKLQDGINTLRIFIDYKQTQVEENSLVITKEIVKSVTPIKSTTQLWFLGIGASKYKNPLQNLDFPDKDVTEIANLFQKQEGVLYQKVNTKVLINENASETNIKNELTSFLNMASENDVIIILLAGHGTQDNDQNLYFMTYDSDLSKPLTGMDISVVKKFLVNRPPNQKALLWLDVCHAGSMGTSMMAKRGGEKLSTDDAIKQLTEGTGTVVLASSTSKESSLEDETFCGGHGAFSCAMIDALNGDADKTSGDTNGVVSLLEMQNFVSRKVIELTKGQQHPTTPQSQNVQDFPLIKY
jgi:outer membrane protein OmpA-like peptidoglycan-associated protein